MNALSHTWQPCTYSSVMPFTYGIWSRARVSRMGELGLTGPGLSSERATDDDGDTL